MLPPWHLEDIQAISCILWNIFLDIHMTHANEARGPRHHISRHEGCILGSIECNVCHPLGATVKPLPALLHSSRASSSLIERISGHLWANLAIYFNQTLPGCTILKQIEEQKHPFHSEEHIDEGQAHKRWRKPSHKTFPS